MPYFPKSYSAPSPTVSYGKLIDKLLDEAFTVLQHDTGDHDLEWHKQREWLAARFKKVLAGNRNTQ